MYSVITTLSDIRRRLSAQSDSVTVHDSMAVASLDNVLQRQRNYGAETQHVCDMEVNHKDCV
jgi:hypothetical protein